MNIQSRLTRMYKYSKCVMYMGFKTEEELAESSYYVLLVFVWELGTDVKPRFQTGITSDFCDLLIIHKIS